jgi:hypothetical protein
MASFGRQFSGSPVLTMSPQHSLQTPRPRSNFARRAHSPKPSIPVAVVQRPTLSATAGRKRSRDEAAVNLEPEAPPLEDGWTYGPGMVLIKTGSSYTLDASSQSGTWVDQKLDDTLNPQSEVANPRSHKSQRLVRDSSVSPHSTPVLESTFDLSTTAANASQSSDDGPIVDDITLQLGIGWRKISSDEHIQAAARGWARYIENHYPVTNARIGAESSGLQSYLVEANEGIFLFDENLRQGRLVSQDAQRALQHLQCRPPTFDGEVTLCANESPRSVASDSQAAAVDTEMSI